MDSNLVFNIFLLFSSWVYVGFSQSLDELVSTYGDALSQNSNISQSIGSLLADAGNGGIDSSMQCMEKLLPCESFLHSTSTPPATCCMPLKEMIANESQCLCSVINNAGILKSFNVTEDVALSLAKSCGAKPDLSVCHNATSPTSSPASPLPPDTASGPSSNATPPSESRTKSAAYGISHFGGSGFIAFFVGLVFYAF